VAHHHARGVEALAREESKLLEPEPRAVGDDAAAGTQRRPGRGPMLELLDQRDVVVPVADLDEPRFLKQDRDYVGQIVRQYNIPRQ
jgi:hypothetical protein